MLTELFTYSFHLGEQCWRLSLLPLWSASMAASAMWMWPPEGWRKGKDLRFAIIWIPPLSLMILMAIAAVVSMMVSINTPPHPLIAFWSVAAASLICSLSAGFALHSAGWSLPGCLLWLTAQAGVLHCLRLAQLNPLPSIQVIELAETNSAVLLPGWQAKHFVIERVDDAEQQEFQADAGWLTVHRQYPRSD